MDCLHRWKYWIRPLVVAVYFLLLVVALPLSIWELNRKDAQKHVMAWFIGGLFVMMALPISFWGILQHLIYYTQPHLQRYIVRILWMVPIYALNAWLGLRFPDAAIYLDTMRECYEAYVIYNFMSYLLTYLQREHPDLDLVLEVKPNVKHIIPFCCLPSWRMGGSFIKKCKHGVLQYTIVRPTTTAIALICELAGVYEEGDFNFKTAWSYIVVINNISQVWAMYCLVMFYRGTKEELKPIRPVPKFMCVKAVVFMSFWQAVVIAALVKTGVISEKQTWVFYTINDVATGIQDFLICIEMFLAAIAHYYSFSHKPFMEGSRVGGDCCATFMSMWDVSDVRDDVVEHVRYLGKNVKKTVGGRVSSSLYRKEDATAERIPLLQYGSESARERSGSSGSGGESGHFSGGASGYTPWVPGRSNEELGVDEEKSSRPEDTDSEVEHSEGAIRSDLLVSVDAPPDMSLVLEKRDFEKSVSPSMNNYLESSVSAPEASEPVPGTSTSEQDPQVASPNSVS